MILCAGGFGRIVSLSLLKNIAGVNGKITKELITGIQNGGNSMNMVSQVLNNALK